MNTKENQPKSAEDTRKLADLSDAEIDAEMKAAGLHFEPQNSGVGPEIVRNTLRSLVSNYRPLIKA